MRGITGSFHKSKIWFTVTPENKILAHLWSWPGRGRKEQGKEEEEQKTEHSPCFLNLWQVPPALSLTSTRPPQCRSATQEDLKSLHFDRYRALQEMDKIIETQHNKLQHTTTSTSEQLSHNCKGRHTVSKQFASFNRQPGSQKKWIKIYISDTSKITKPRIKMFHWGKKWWTVMTAARFTTIYSISLCCFHSATLHSATFSNAGRSLF